MAVRERRGGVRPHLDEEEHGEAVVAGHGEPADDPVPGQRRRGGGAWQRREDRDGVAEAAREDVHADETRLERGGAVGGRQEAGGDGARVDSEAEREVGRGDAAAEEREQAVGAGPGRRRRGGGRRGERRV